MLKIKLAPRGKTHQITYRFVIAEDRSKLNGKVIDDLGFYTPQTKELQIDKEKMADWIKKGAQATTGVDRLLNPDKYPKKVKEKVEKEVSKNVEANHDSPVQVEEKIEEIVEESAVAETPIEATEEKSE